MAPLVKPELAHYQCRGLNGAVDGSMTGSGIGLSRSISEQSLTSRCSSTNRSVNQCQRRFAFDPPEVRTFFWTRLCCQANALPVGFGALSSERHLDTFFVVPPEIAVKFIDESIYGDACP